MGKINSIKPVKLFISITYKDIKVYKKVLSLLKKHFGRVSHVHSYCFSSFSDYYHKEMDYPLGKIILTFSSLIHKDNAPTLKHISNDIEMELADANLKRSVNIDPGYLTEAKVILLTTKNFAHRIYIGMGIFAEITLSYRKNSFSPNSWTYPDYRSSGVISFFNNTRQHYRKQLI